MGIFNIIQQNQKGRLLFFLRQLQYILYLGILISGCIGNHSLMLSGFRHLIQAFPGNIFYEAVRLFGLPLNGHNRAVLTVIQNKNPVDGLAGTECFDYRITPFNSKFFVSHNSSFL